jgi:hypothetical protein
VFQEAADVTEQGCKLSWAIRLKAVTTTLPNVSMSGEPAMLCSFAQGFSGWVREVAAPLALGHMGQRLARIETGEAVACAKGDAVDIAAFVLAFPQEFIGTFESLRCCPAGCGRKSLTLGDTQNA